MPIGIKTRRRSRRKKIIHAYGRKTIKSVSYQTGKIKSRKLDRTRKAMLPGKRRSRSGKIYWETRRNRSDRRGRKL